MAIWETHVCLWPEECKRAGLRRQVYTGCERSIKGPGFIIISQDDDI
jgi:hypothetical protein